MIFALLAHAAPVPGYVDLHIHLAAHLAVPTYGTGPDSDPPAQFSNRHALQAQIFTPQLSEPGPSVLVSLAYANPFFTDFESRTSMRARIERQLDFVEAYAAAHADRFGFARTPADARAIVASGRTAIVHGIEGATKVLDGPEDARFWADRGVAVITPVHLADSRIGGAWCQEGSLFVLNIPGCWREALGPRRHGLTPWGVARVGDLIDAGIVIDLAHSTHVGMAQLMDLAEARGVAPVNTHVTPFAVRQDTIAVTDEELRRTAALGGLVGVTASLAHLPPHPVPPGVRCPGSIDDFRTQWDHVVAVSAPSPVAWGSDFQGGVDHLGPQDCRPGTSTIEAQGLAHPGLVEPLFAQLAAWGSDRAPLDASAERFVTIWERAVAARRGSAG